MSLSDGITLQLRRGLKADLPAWAAAGEPLWCEDTHELYFGAGEGLPLTKLPTGVIDFATATSTLFEDNSAVYQDGKPGVADPLDREGWYFKNAVAGWKLNWYYFDPTQFIVTVAGFRTAYAIVKPDNLRVPYFAVYTKPTGSGDAAVWYKSRRVYAVQSAQAVAGKTHLLYTGQNPSIFPTMPRIQFSETVSLSKGAFSADEVINLVTLQTDSGVGANNYSFVTSALGFETNDTKKEYMLQIKANYTIEGIKKALNREIINRELQA